MEQRKFKLTVDPLAVDYRSCAVRALEVFSQYKDTLVRDGMLNYAAFCMAQEGAANEAS